MISTFEFLEKFMLAWIPLFVAMDPIGLVPLFLGVTEDLSPEARKKTTMQATWPCITAKSWRGISA